MVNPMVISGTTVDRGVFINLNFDAFNLGVNDVCQGNLVKSLDFDKQKVVTEEKEVTGLARDIINIISSNFITF